MAVCRTRWAGGSAAVFVLLWTFAQTAAAGGSIDDRWSVSFSLGGSLPALDAINDGLFQSPLTGTATVLIQEGIAVGNDPDPTAAINETEVIPFRFENELQPVEFASQGGIEFLWHPNERHAFIIGFGSLEHTSVNNVAGNLPLQQYFVRNQVDSERRGKISHTEYTVGWRYHFFRREDYRFYTRLSLHEVFDIDYRENLVFLFTDSPIQDLIGVRRNLVVSAQSSSLLMGQIGVGGEWFLTDWFSLGIEGGYLFGEREFSLSDVEILNDFVGGDNISRTGMPFREMADGTLGYLLPGTTSDDLADPETREDFYRSLRLKFDGFRVLFRASLYF